MRTALFLALILASCAGRRVPGTVTGPVEHLPYTVQWGDTLTSIATRFAVPGGYPALARDNELWSPDWIEDGQVLQVPATRAARDALGDHPDPAELPTLEPLPLPLLPPPRPAQVEGCLAAACVEIDGRTHVCACEQGERDQMVLRRVEGPPLSWAARIPAEPDTSYWAEGGLADFAVSRVDLDADGDVELLVAQRVLTDDLGRSTWRVALVEEADQQAPPVLFTAGNLGAGSLVAGAGRAVDLWLTSWELYRPEGARLPRYYLVGRRYTYADGALRPTDDPVLRRRLTYDFVPGTGPQGTGTPLADVLAAPEALAGEPITAGAREVETVRIEAVHQGARIGDRRRARLYPPDYDPGELLGTEALAVRYEGGLVLWR